MGPAATGGLEGVSRSAPSRRACISNPNATGGDFARTIEAVRVVVEVKVVPTVGDVLALARRDTDGGYPVLVARRVSHDVAAVLADYHMGFFDARGPLAGVATPHC